jgi:hypothetical protein
MQSYRKQQAASTRPPFRFFGALFAALVRNSSLRFAVAHSEPNAANLFAISQHAIHILAAPQRFASKSAPAVML